jgi:hypothetical protein
LKTFRIAIDIESKCWEYAEAYIEAETLEEAVKLFKENPHDYDWDNWETFDSETLGWEVNEEQSGYDQWMTEYMEIKNADVQGND